MFICAGFSCTGETRPGKACTGKAVLGQKSPKGGEFRAVFGWTDTVPTRRGRAQTGAFLAATGAVCGDGVELVCVQLLAGG